MAETKADRSAAAQKAAITRKRNKEKTEAEIAGKKAAGTREERNARHSLSQATTAVGEAVSHLTPAVGSAASSLKTAAGHLSDAAKAAGRSSDNRQDAAEKAATK